MAQNQYFDVKPKLWEGSVLFNDLINVVPVPAPRTWMWTRLNDIVDNSDNNYFFYRKRKWIKYVDTYHMEDDDMVLDTDEWLDWEFTDMAILNWRRYFLRKDRSWTKLRVYTQIEVSPKWQLCDDLISQWKIVALRVPEDLTHPLNSWVSQMYDDWITFRTTKNTYWRFLKTQWVIDAIHPMPSEDDPWTIPFYIIRWMRDEEDSSIWTAVNYYVVDLWLKEDLLLSEWITYLYFREKWLTVELKNKVCDDIVSSFWLEEWVDHNYYFVDNDALLANYPFTKWDCDDFYWVYDDKIRYDVEVSYASKYWDNLAFCTSTWIVALSWITPSNEDYNLTWIIPCSDTITSATMWNNRICFLTSAWWLFVSGEWYSQYNFVTWPAWITDWDQIHWIYNVWTRFTTIIPEYYTLVLAWPHVMAYWMWYKTSNYSENQWLYELSDRVWIFSSTSYCAKDGKIFIWRSYKDIYMLEMSPNSYWMQTWNFTYYSATWWTRLKDLVQWHQEMNIDMTDNEMFVSIYEQYNRNWSMVLCEDRHYNCRYVWLFEWIKVTRVFDWWQILLWDRIYEYWYDYDIETNNEKHDIREVANIIFWDETPTANKFLAFYKIAIWDNSIISDKTWINTNVTSWWRLWDRSVHLTNTRYISMLNSKTSDEVIRKWDFGYEIKWHWKRNQSWFQRELETYANLPSLQKYNPRQWAWTHSWLWLYSVIKENIWQEWELLQITLIAHWNDNLEFGSVFIWRYQKDYDFADKEDVNVDDSEFTSDSEDEWKINVETEQ